MRQMSSLRVLKNETSWVGLESTDTERRYSEHVPEESAPTS